MSDFIAKPSSLDLSRSTGRGDAESMMHQRSVYSSERVQEQHEEFQLLLEKIQTVTRIAMREGSRCRATVTQSVDRSATPWLFSSSWITSPPPPLLPLSLPTSARMQGCSPSGHCRVQR